VKIFGYTVPQLYKAIAAGTGIAVMFLGAVLPFVPEAWLAFYLAVTGAATWLATFLAKNAPLAEAAPPTAPPAGFL
jgi:hypothetical protein